MRYFDQETVEDFLARLIDAQKELLDLSAQVVAAGGVGNSEEMHRHLHHGAARRLRVLSSSIRIAFDVYPPDLERPLDRDDLDVVQIALHAFFMNLFGLFDNLAWAFLWRHGLQGPGQDGKYTLPGFNGAAAQTIQKNGIGMKMRATRAALPLEIVDFWDQKDIASWYTDYLVHYRDSLAHRIPLYIVPSACTPEHAKDLPALQAEIDACASNKDWEGFLVAEDKMYALGFPYPAFLLSRPSKDDKPVLLHPQLLNDAMSARIAVENFLQFWHLRR